MSDIDTQRPIPTSRHWQPAVKMAVAILTLIALGILAWQVSSILPLIVLALLFGYLLHPFTTFIDNRLLGGKRRGAAAGLALVTFIIVALLVILLLIPPLATQVSEFAERIPQFLESAQEMLDETLTRSYNLFGQTIVPLDYIEQVAGTRDLGEIFTQINPGTLVERVVSSFSGLIAPTFGILGRVFGTLISLTIFITLLYYLMRDGRKFIDTMVCAVPDGYEGDARRGFYELNQIWSAYLRGQLILSLIIGVLTYIAALILGLPSPLIIGVIAGFLELIPNIGPLITAFIAGFIALISESSTFPGLSGVSFVIVVTVVQVVIQQLEAVVFVPRVMGSNLKLHPFAVMVAVLAGSALAGALGVILAAPALATLRLVLRYIDDKLNDRLPFEQEKEPPATDAAEAAPPVTAQGYLPPDLSA